MKALKLIEKDIIKYIIIEKNNLNIKNGKVKYSLNNCEIKESDFLKLEIVEMDILDRDYLTGENKEKIIIRVNDKEEIVFKNKNCNFFYSNKG